MGLQKKNNPKLLDAQPWGLEREQGDSLLQYVIIDPLSH